MGLEVKDFKQLVPNMRAAFSHGIKKYNIETPAKLKLVDNMVMLCLLMFAVQLVYGLVFVRDPFNSFIAGTFCSMGMFALTMGLRIQLSTHAESFGDYSMKQLVFEYMIGSLIMFFASFLLMG